MTRASLRRRINKAKAQKHSLPSKSKQIRNLDSEPKKSVTFTDEDGFQLVLKKKERALMKKAQLDDCCGDLHHPAANEDADVTNITMDCDDTTSVKYSDDGLDAQSTVSKSWVRKRLKQIHAGGVSRPSCKKRQRDMFRRVLLHTHLQLHSQPNARGQCEIHNESVTPDTACIGPADKVDMADGENRTANCMQLVGQWAQFSSSNAAKIGRGKKRSKKKKKTAENKGDMQGEKKSTVKSETVIPFRTQATATIHAINAFRTILQKF